MLEYRVVIRHENRYFETTLFLSKFDRVDDMQLGRDIIRIYGMKSYRDEGFKSINKILREHKLPLELEAQIYAHLNIERLYIGDVTCRNCVIKKQEDKKEEPKEIKNKVSDDELVDSVKDDGDEYFWALGYNQICKECIHDCKQSARVRLIQCLKYTKQLEGIKCDKCKIYKVETEIAISTPKQKICKECYDKYQENINTLGVTKAMELWLDDMEA